MRVPDSVMPFAYPQTKFIMMKTETNYYYMPLTPLDTLLWCVLVNCAGKLATSNSPWTYIEDIRIDKSLQHVMFVLLEVAKHAMEHKVWSLSVIFILYRIIYNSCLLLYGFAGCNDCRSSKVKIDNG